MHRFGSPFVPSLDTHELLRPDERSQNGDLCPGEQRCPN